MALDQAPGLEGLEGERLHVFLERHSVLQPLGHRDGKAAQDSAQGGPLLGEIDEQLPERAVGVLAGAEEDLVAAHLGFLGPAAAAAGQQETGTVHPVIGRGGADPRGEPGKSPRLGVDGHHQIDRLLVVGVALTGGRRQWLARLRPVPVQGHRLESELGREGVGLLDLGHRGLMGHVDGLGDRSGDEGLRRRHRPDVPGGMDEALAVLAVPVGGVEHREVLRRQVRGPLDGLHTADHLVGSVDLSRREAQCAQQVEVERGVLVLGETEALQGCLAHHEHVEGVAQVEHAGEGGFDGVDLAVGEPLGRQ